MGLPMEVFKLCDEVGETGFAMHRYLRNGHVEKVYENALVHRLQCAVFAGRRIIHSRYATKMVLCWGAFLPTFFSKRRIIELMAVAHVLDEHVAQLLGYLRASRVEHGVLVNFGAPKFHIRKYALRDAPPPSEGEIDPPSF
jgi:GxxExxY protein